MSSIREILKRITRLLTYALLFLLKKLDEEKRLEGLDSAKLLDTPPTESSSYDPSDYHKWADKNRN